MAISIKEVPLHTRLATKSVRGLKPETIRENAKIVVKIYDEKSYIAGLKRGNVFVKKFVVPAKQEGKILTLSDVETNIRVMVTNGDFDQALIHDYRRKKSLASAAPKRGRGRPRKNPA
ncbi:MAG: hypothetical protein FJY97_02245 [candidate division Zixibacteria bacterium]|nr:hypothetical protein [candidate division Zixibacteria bacterium]